MFRYNNGVMKIMKLKYIGILPVLVFTLASCEKALDKTDLTAMNGETVFNDSTLARTYVDYIYDQNLPGWGGTWGNIPSYSEESFGESKYFEGTLQISDVSDLGTSSASSSNYGKIRAINQFLQEVETGSLSRNWKNLLEGQAYFFRAWRYWELVKLYGGVPLVLSPLDAVGSEAKDAARLPRNTTSECIAQISKDLDKAMELLPGKWSNTSDWGRVTSGTAAALKGRVLLYWASPEFNPSDLADRWQAAYDANKKAYDLLTANGYGLNSSYDNMWFQEVNNPEAVFVTGYNTATGDQTKKNNGYDNNTRPAYLGTNGGSNQPSWQMVKAYPMKDGKMPGSSKYAYSDQLFYKNRDPRFDKTIAYNGCNWPITGVTNYRLWTYYVGSKSVESQKPTSTGFYCRKAIDPNVSSSNVQYSGTDWMEIRFAEVVLNLAESACGINKLDEAYSGLVAIRKRAGIEAGSDNLYGLTTGMNRAAMFTTILNERLYEFAFEGKRFWDLRRWKLFESTLNGTRRTGITITLKSSGVPSDFAANRDTYATNNLDDVYTKYFTIASKTLDTKYAINWQSTYYFFPIPQAAIDNDPNLLQNVGWNNGTFDPTK